MISAIFSATSSTGWETLLMPNAAATGVSSKPITAGDFK